MKERIALENRPVALSAEQEEMVLDAISRVCKFRGWSAHTVQFRNNDVHVVVSGDEKPEKIMVDFKAYATRAIRKHRTPNASEGRA
jgi:REP element-mobilizing transposase RayT